MHQASERAIRRPADGLPGQRKKILYVIGTLDVGGAETQLVELATRLDRSKFEPVVCCLSSGGELAARLETAGVPLHRLGFQGFPASRFGYVGCLPSAWRLLRQFWTIMRRERPQLLHGFLFWAYVLGTFVGRPAGIPFIVASRRSLGLFKADRPHYLLLEQLANRMTDVFIANSEAVRQDTASRERIRLQDILVIRNGLDLARFSEPSQPSLAAALELTGTPRVIVVSNFIRYKGHEYFFHAWRDVLAQFPSAIALLVGDGVLRGELEQLADALGIRHSLRFLGVRHDVPELLALADVYVHPSLQEGYSNALLEAMAAGRAVVATAVGGNVEAVDDGVTGLLVPPRDSGALSSAMLRLLITAGLARDMGERARQFVREQHAMDGMVRAYESVYADLLSRASRPRARKQKYMTRDSAMPGRD